VAAGCVDNLLRITACSVRVHQLNPSTVTCLEDPAPALRLKSYAKLLTVKTDKSFIGLCRGPVQCRDVSELRHLNFRSGYVQCVRSWSSPRSFQIRRCRGEDKQVLFRRCYGASNLDQVTLLSAQCQWLAHTQRFAVQYLWLGLDPTTAAPLATTTPLEQPDNAIVSRR